MSSLSPKSQIMRTDVRKVRHLGSAKAGTQHLWRMRLTSVALVPLTIGFVWILLSLVGKDYNAARAMLSAPLPAITLLLFVATGVWHMQIGMATIIEDYVSSPHRREWALMANLFASAVLGLACIYAILKISFV